MSGLLVECIFILVLVVANGVFALAEIAIVSSRKARLRQMAEGGNRSAQTALQLAEAPEDFLSTVQVGITLIGILAGVFGGATLAEKLAVHIKAIDALAPYAYGIAMGIVVAIITYLSLIIGELVPKRVGLSNPEKIACIMARPMLLLSRFAAPLVALLTASGNAVLWLLRVKPSTEPAVTEEEVKFLIKEGTKAGVFEEHEQDIVERVFKFTDRKAGSIMTRRSDIVWLDINDPEEVTRQKIHASPHSYFPVADGRLSNFLGMVSVKRLWLSNAPLNLRSGLDQPLFVPTTMPAAELLNLFRSTRIHVAVVVDEFGAIIGLATISDILSAIVGDIEVSSDEGTDLVRRPDGSWLLDGMIPIEHFKEHFKFKELPGEERAVFTTLGGFLMMSLGRIPRVADRFEFHGYRFEIVDMDGRRVDKVLMTPPGVELKK